MSFYSASRAWSTQSREDTSGDKLIQIAGLAIIVIFVILQLTGNFTVWRQSICISPEVAALATSSYASNWTKIDSNSIAYFSQTSDPVQITVPEGGSVTGYNFFTRERVRITEGSLPSTNFVVTCP